jgi:CspA family cold shock protein
VRRFCDAWQSTAPGIPDSRRDNIPEPTIEGNGKVQKGRVKWYNVTKGFGFIEPDAGGKDSFVHVTALIGEKELFVDDRVEFDVETNQRTGKEQATRVRVIA